MTLRSMILTFRIHRFETTVVVGAALLAVVVSAIVISLFNAGGYAQCYMGDGPIISTLCQASIGQWLNRIARLSVSIVPIFPYMAGLLAGGPIVARELENGTARLAWSLGPSRLRWFGQRVLPTLAMIGAATLAVGLTADALTHLLQPSADLDQSFVGFRARGLLVGIEGLLVGSIALAFGALLGRIVPTIVLTLILAGGIGIAVDNLERGALTNEALIADGETYNYTESNLFIDSRLKFPDGQVLDYNHAMAVHPEIQNGWDDTSGIRNVILYVPGSRYHEVERREAAVLGGLALAFVGLASITVIRRRPR